MTIAIIVGIVSGLLNIFLVWYIVRLLRKFLFVSENLADLFLTFKSFEMFTTSLYNMEMFYGEPVIQDLILKTKVVRAEVEGFRDIFEYTLDPELEEEIDGLATEAEETN